MRTILVSIAALLPLLAACSGGGAANAPSNVPVNQPVTPPAAPAGPKLWAWGEFVGGWVSAPFRISGPDGIARLATPPAEKPTWVMAVADGKLWVWGKDAPGKFIGGLTNSPKALEQFSGVTDVAVRGDQCAVLADGKVWLWGTASEKPEAVETSDRVSALFAAPSAINAVAENGKMWPIIDEYANPHNVDYLVSHTSYARDLEAHLSTTGDIWLYGNADRGQLGDGSAPKEAVSKKCGFTQKSKQIALGDGFVVALAQDGTIWTWGDNKGALGHGASWSTEKSRKPGQIIGLTGIVQVQAAGRSAYALDDKGNLWCWGDNDRGQLGLGDKTRRHTPAKLQGMGKVKWFHAAPNAVYCETE
ncbi:MAG: hypothetical protein IPK87_10960 [Planctomycetes bacterium]|nr:hypothetical protein [Planctomycetota bacterium]